MATASTSPMPSAGASPSRRYVPRSLRLRLQLWLALLLVCLLAAMIAMAYELQRVNRFQQIDAELEIRLMSLTLNVRELVRNSPPPVRPSGPPLAPRGPREGDAPGRRGVRPPSDRLPRNEVSPLAAGRSGPPALQLSPQTAALFGAGSGYYFTIWSRDGDSVERSANAPPDLPVPERSQRDTLPHQRTRATWREAV